MKILALDLGRKLGWAFYPGDGRLGAGVHTVSKQGAGLYVVTHAFTDWLQKHLDAWSPELVAYERPFRQHRQVKGSKASEMHLGMAGIAAGVSQATGAKVESYAVNTIKARVAGNGRASKDAVKRAVHYYWRGHLEQLLPGKEPESMDDNMSDALAVLLCSLWEHDPRWAPAIEIKF